jgi:hypothetical protein
VKAGRRSGGHRPMTSSSSPLQEILIESSNRSDATSSFVCTLFIVEFFGRDIRELARLFADTVLPHLRD